jgi:hypothetical protein
LLLVAIGGKLGILPDRVYPAEKLGSDAFNSQLSSIVAL